MKPPISFNITFVEGSISLADINKAMQIHNSLNNSGAWNIFIGQVRADKINEKTVSAIEYTSYEEMAQENLSKIINDCAQEISIDYVQIIHSIGIVKSGEMCLFVAVACGHRKESYLACETIVERLKKEAPIWGKEIFEDESHQWKVNS